MLLVDGEPSDASLFPEGEIVLLEELAVAHAGWYASKFTAAEFSNALKPAFLNFLAAFARRVIYLDCDIAVFSRFSEMIGIAETCPLVLVPHMLTPLPRPQHYWLHPSRTDLFNSGLNQCRLLRR